MIDLDIHRKIHDLGVGPGFDAEDPRAVIGLVAEKLARALDERASAAVARELRSSVEYLCDDPNADGDRVDEVRAKRAARRLGLLLSGMGD